ncbi:DUF4190 domain-containing protein [Imperialibacter roseus]|uniref:DUF4190 domain-containing protein n=1 Tax=Imperialibacter roseus TaxID=1324217 RepID=A0ABZ0IRB5_9BACT|nr:DUF4190 domain-containing protein [Imperialibacter roseus]WOK06704.1 DUF4190 domain-containing protein [Imperialibacter roseus]
MRYIIPFLLFGFLLTQCKSKSYYQFSPPPASYYEQLYASANNIDYQKAAINSLVSNGSILGNLDSGQDSASLYSHDERPGSQKKALTASKKPSAVSPSYKEQGKNDARGNTQRLPDEGAPKPNALAHVSFFSSIGLILLYVFLQFSSPIGAILALSLPVIAVTAGIIALIQIKKYHEMGKHLAIFGICVGGLAFILAILALIQISKAPPI